MQDWELEYGLTTVKGFMSISKFIKFSAYTNISISLNKATLFGGRMIYLNQYDLLQVEQQGYETATIHPSEHHTYFEGFYMQQ